MTTDVVNITYPRPLVNRFGKMLSLSHTVLMKQIGSRHYGPNNGCDHHRTARAWAHTHRPRSRYLYPCGGGPGDRPSPGFSLNRKIASLSKSKV